MKDNIFDVLMQDITVAKYCSRFSLGFSDTTRTIVVQQNQIKLVEDIVTANGEVMSDGCGAISMVSSKHFSY